MWRPCVMIISNSSLTAKCASEIFLNQWETRTYFYWSIRDWETEIFSDSRLREREKERGAMNFVLKAVGQVEHRLFTFSCLSIALCKNFWHGKCVCWHRVKRLFCLKYLSNSTIMKDYDSSVYVNVETSSVDVNG